MTVIINFRYLPTLHTYVMCLRNSPLTISCHFELFSIKIHRSQFFLPGNGVQVVFRVKNIHEKSPTFPSSTKAILLLCDVITNNGKILHLFARSLQSCVLDQGLIRYLLLCHT